MKTRECDHCGKLPATEALGSMLMYCEPCLAESCDEFAVDFGYMTLEEAIARREQRGKVREAMAEVAA